jgi:hypothetical protein
MDNNMFWFLNNPKTNPNGIIEFYQIFVDSNEVYTDEEANTIYSFNSNNLKFNIDTTNYKSANINSKIKIIDHIISYNMENQKTDCVFTIKTNFINPQDNQYGVPIFLHMYKSVSNKRLPNLIETEYTNVYELNFQVYNIEPNNSQVQFIVETNQLTNEKRKYFVVSDLNLIQKYHITNK